MSTQTVASPTHVKQHVELVGLTECDHGSPHPLFLKSCLAEVASLPFLGENSEGTLILGSP